RSGLLGRRSALAQRHEPEDAAGLDRARARPLEQHRGRGGARRRVGRGRLPVLPAGAARLLRLRPRDAAAAGGSGVIPRSILTLDVGVTYDSSVLTQWWRLAGVSALNDRHDGRPVLAVQLHVFP